MGDTLIGVCLTFDSDGRHVIEGRISYLTIVHVFVFAINIISINMYITILICTFLSCC
jgi:hypothetical protein